MIYFTSDTHIYHATLLQCSIYAILFNMAKAKTAAKPKTSTSKRTVKTPVKKAQKTAVSKPTVPPLPPNIKCSFCRKSPDTARRIIAGPPPDNAFICDECLFVCVKILAEENPKETYAENRENTPKRGKKTKCPIIADQK